MKKTISLIVCLLSLTIYHPTIAQDWQQTNGPNGGSVSGLALNGSSTYACIGNSGYYKEAGGVFKTEDNGSNWTAINAGLLNTNVNTIYAKDNVLFAGTIAGYDAADAGVFRSFNQGETWESCGIASQTITCFIHQGIYIFAGTSTGGVFRSSDDGTTWESKNTGLATGGVQDFAKNGTYLFVVRNKNVYRSSNNGDTWTAINTGLPSSGPFRFIATIASKGDTLYAGTSNITNLLDGVYKSTNSGTNWALTGLSNTAITELFTRGDDVYASIPGVGVQKSSDFGVTWTLTTLPIGQSSFIANGETIFSGNPGIGVFRSTDEGQNWNLVDNGMRGQCIRTLGSNNTTIFAGTALCGIHKTMDNGQNWVASNNGININTQTIQTLDVFGSNIFITANGGGTLIPYRSNDNGENWTALNLIDPPQFYAAIGNTIFASLYVAHSYDDTLQIWRSPDSGVTWELTPGTGTGIQQTGLLATIGSNLFLFTNNKVYRSVNNASSWIEISNLTGAYTVTVCNSILFCSTTNGIYKSDDLGITWEYSNFSQLAMHLVSNDNMVFAETDREIYATANYGNTWVRVDNETITSTSIFPYVYGYALAATSDFIYTGVGHRSIYKNALSDFTAPIQPSAIGGSSTPCIGSSVIYSVTNVPGVTYVWQFPSGWVITDGGTTSSVTVTVGNSPGIVLVTPSNGWGSGPSQYLFLSPVTCLEKTLNLTVFLEGLYNGASRMREANGEAGPQFGEGIADEITVELHNSADYSVTENTFSNVQLDIYGNATITLPAELTGDYYISINHRNSIETVSALPVSFAGSTITYAFDAPEKAYGSNLLQMIDGTYVIYGGDVTQDGSVDTGDLTPVDNDQFNFVSGYFPTDVNGDGTVDTGDLTIID
ncbi:MAG: hypothetical protein V1775_18675, partial [Bacteroidota bacterium]